jgi:membrane-associated PAP2 superfamily phosphatase
MVEKPRDLWLTLGSVALGILLYLLAKTPTLVVICVVAIFGLLVHPVWHFWWIEESLARRVGALIILAGVLVFVGEAAWPREGRAASDQAKVISTPVSTSSLPAATLMPTTSAGSP